ncbi:heptaprenyl diphosphate synthase [Macrococcus equipercicus]|uniref:Heptaprenyl diphosphate synthase n=2 Tax=Macrococcus equipercicus TaxID=69967 RepID=A0ABQ6RA28_9STAP|nr:heptaprenyl diphosphate synthase [Macrococcus equipercicus]
MITMNESIRSVESLLNEVISDNHSSLNEAGKHILTSGGKRIRPYFVLLAGTFGSADDDTLIRTATALEIIHMASLVHDDYIDNSAKRRGVSAVHEEWNAPVAIQTGHYLLASALNLISGIDNQSYHQYFADVILEVCYGEFAQMEDQFNTAVSFTKYLRRINRKTAILLEASCKLGGLSTGAADKEIYHLGKFGHFMGMSFQIIDDVLDYTSNEAALGKPVGSDIRNGHMTLPLMCAVKHDAQLSALLAELHAGQSEDYFRQVIEAVRAAGITPALDISAAYARKAAAHLHELPETPARAKMQELLDRMTRRTH